MCSTTRYLVVAAFAGVAAASLTGSDLVGAAAAVLAAALTWLAARLLPGRAATCTVDRGAARHDVDQPERRDHVA